MITEYKYPTVIEATTPQNPPQIGDIVKNNIGEEFVVFSIDLKNQRMIVYPKSMLRNETI